MEFLLLGGEKLQDWLLANFWPTVAKLGFGLAAHIIHTPQFKLVDWYVSGGIHVSTVRSFNHLMRILDVSTGKFDLESKIALV